MHGKRGRSEYLSMWMFFIGMLIVINGAKRSKASLGALVYDVANDVRFFNLRMFRLSYRFNMYNN